MKNTKRLDYASPGFIDRFGRVLAWTGAGALALVVILTLLQ